MKATKAWYLSRGIWGGIASMIAGAGMFVGIEVDPEQLTQTLMNLAGPITAIIGGLVSAIGRKQARERIK